MNFSDLLKMLAIGLLSASTVGAQSSAYAKFGSAGETIGLFQLMKEPAGCKNWRTVVGDVIHARANVGEREVRYRFSMKSHSWTYAFTFELEKDAIPLRDVQNLLSSRRPLRVRACRDAKSGWGVNDIARLQMSRGSNTEKRKENERTN